MNMPPHLQVLQERIDALKQCSPQKTVLLNFKTFVHQQLHRVWDKECTVAEYEENCAQYFLFLTITLKFPLNTYFANYPHRALKQLTKEDLQNRQKRYSYVTVANRWKKLGHTAKQRQELKTQAKKLYEEDHLSLRDIAAQLKLPLRTVQVWHARRFAPFKFTQYTFLNESHGQCHEQTV